MIDDIQSPDGIFYNGVSAREHQVQVTCAEYGVKISAQTLNQPVEWAYDDIRTVADLANHKGASFRVMGGLGRLDITDETLIDRLENLAPNLRKSDIPITTWKRITIWGAGAFASVIIIIFVIIPGLASQLATMIPVDKEIALGQASLKQIERVLGYGKDKPLTCTGVKGQAALDKMAARLTTHFDSPYPLDIKVFNDQTPNAFAVPGGHIVLFDGLLEMADSPEEVAAVLGHEMGHVIHRDPTRLTLRSAGSIGILGMIFGDFAGGAAALIVAERLIAADYSQDAEANADRFAHGLLQDAKLPSTPMAKFFEKLKNRFGDGPKLLSHIASHPDLQGRAEAANNADSIGEGPFDTVLSVSEWKDLQGICSQDVKAG